MHLHEETPSGRENTPSYSPLAESSIDPKKTESQWIHVDHEEPT